MNEDRRRDQRYERSAREPGPLASRTEHVDREREVEQERRRESRGIPAEDHRGSDVREDVEQKNRLQEEERPKRGVAARAVEDPEADGCTQQSDNKQGADKTGSGDLLHPVRCEWMKTRQRIRQERSDRQPLLRIMRGKDERQDQCKSVGSHCACAGW